MQLSLDGQWRLRQVGQDEWIPAAVPGCVHTDLLAAGKIPDPLIGTNELDVLWVDEADWEFERTFTLDEEALRHPGQWLECDGLDTVAEIVINDQPLASTFNMFRRYRFDVADHLQPGENTIRILFRSPIRYGAARQAEDTYERPGTQYEWASGRTRKVYRPYVRKAQYQFGWDWGPCLATSGIWRSMRLVLTDTPQIDSVTTQQLHADQQVTLRVTANVVAPNATRADLHVFWNDGKTPVATAAVEVPAGESTHNAEFAIESPELWWPAGIGPQHLHSMTVRLLVDGEVIDENRARIGLRQLELVRRPDDVGETFTFRVNGRDVFCKGANWIPADPFPSRVSRERYQALIRATVDANMNMLRIWGGGIYEDAAFYELCDEMGVMIWHDFMFACAIYPVDDAFLDEVRAEVRDQIRRLINHPSIVLWCGDNEIEWIAGAFWEPTKQFPPLLPDHDRLINRTVAPVVQAEDPARPWWRSSPVGGPQPNSITHGDVHWWDVWSWGKWFDAYQDIVPRFCSEFGFQALPSWRTLQSAVGDKMLPLDNDVMVHHQRQPGANQRLIDSAERLFGRARDLDEFSYHSQITQGLALKCGVEHWRRNKPRCMGTLYWQLQDCWVVASWATIDYLLRYKAGHYFAKRFYSPLLGSIVDDGERLDVWLTSDVDRELSVKYTLTAWHVDGTKLGQVSDEMGVIANQSLLASGVPWPELTRGAKDNEVIAHLVVSAGNLQHENLHIRGNYKDLALATAGISQEIITHDGSPTVKLGTDKPALFVELDSGDVDGVFEDNYFALLPGQPVTIRFRPNDPNDAARLGSSLRVRCLTRT